ncbi:MAG TPA: 1,4-alpha-glucan branching protein domain-containing protein [Verrucomicrobiae bacterium]
MAGYLSLVLHAHLPFVRHPEHGTFLEESWLFEAITECYIPLLQMLRRWLDEGIRAPLTVTLTPTLCALLRDPLLQQRYATHLEQMLDLSEKELLRTLWEKPFNELARFYHHRLVATADFYRENGRDLISGFRDLQNAGQLEIITSAATHAVLPLLLPHTPSIRGQILVACDQYRADFGRAPRGIWLPECAYDERLEPFLAEANLRWFILDTAGVLRARPKPRYGAFAPLLSHHGLAVFGRDRASARQVWSRNEGYPGDPRYRDFYRDIGFDLDWDYLKPYLATAGRRAFTGIKYHAITGPGVSKQVYSRPAALQAADGHAGHFLDGLVRQVERAAAIMQHPPLVVAPYDAELFGHWWYEGPEFLDLLVRKAFYDQKAFAFITPSEYLRRHPDLQVATPAASSWGEGGYWGMWLNDASEWIYPHLKIAQDRMTSLARRFSEQDEREASGMRRGNKRVSAGAPQRDDLRERALRQAARELLLAQASDWPFMLRTGTSPEYAKGRIKSHLARFASLYDQLTSGQIDVDWLGGVENTDNLFQNLDWRYWR